MKNKNKAWKRSKSVPYPSIWCRFDGRKEINGVIPKFWIQDIAEDEYETVVNHMVDKYLNDEPISAYSKLTSDPESVEELRVMWRKVLKEKLGLICYMENSDANGKPIIAAINCMHIKRKFDKNITPKGVKASQFIGPVKFLSNMKNAFQLLGVNEFLNGVGLYVLPQFRGQGLGLELLKARELLCKAVGIKATVTAFSAATSQILAERAGFKDLSAISYADLERANPTLSFPGIQQHSKVLKYMYKVY